MKSKYYLMAAAMLSLAACTDINEPNIQGNNKEGISFADPFVKNTTRATGDLTNSNLTNQTIHVWADTYDAGGSFDGSNANVGFDETLTYANAAWGYDGEAKKWEDKEYDFAAFAPAGSVSTTDVAYQNGTFRITNIPVVQKISNTDASLSGDDYLVSNKTTVKTTDTDARKNGVDLTFKHILSRLNLYAWTSLDSKYTVKLNSLSIYLPKSTTKATYTEASHAGPGSTDTWAWGSFSTVSGATAATALTDYESYPVQETATEALPTTAATAAELSNHFFVAPTAVDATYYLSLSYDITNTAGDSKTITKFVPISGLTKFNQGHQTNLYVCITADVISFSVAVEDWAVTADNDNNFANQDGHSFGFTAQQVGLHIEGVLKAKGNTNSGITSNPLEYTASSFGLNDGAADGVTDSELTISGWYDNADCTGTPVNSPTATNIYGKYTFKPDSRFLTATGKYTLKIKTQQGDENSYSINMDFAEMKFTITTTDTSKEFTVPLGAATSIPDERAMSVVWGDGTKSVSEPTSLAVKDGQMTHAYSAAQSYQIRILSAQTDVTKQQIPEFNFGKYPTELLPWKSNPNAELLHSIDSHVLYTGTDNLDYMFYATENLASIHKETFYLHPNATSMNCVIAPCNGNEVLKSIPAGLFDYATKVTNMNCLFADDHALTDIPNGLFDNCTSLQVLSSAFMLCTSLETIPSGLFANNKSVTNFVNLLSGCKKLKLDADIFIDAENGITKEYRFIYVNEWINFSNAFSNTGSSLSGDGNIGTVPDLWNYTFNTSGWGYTGTYTICGITGGSDVTWYTNSDIINSTYAILKNSGGSTRPTNNFIKN